MVFTISCLPLFEKMQMHLLQLSKLQPTDIAFLGYSNPGDLEGLYQDRLTCLQLSLQMYTQWWMVCRTFPMMHPVSAIPL
jgi:hypothetical protein